MNTDNLVPLVTVAAEVGLSADELAQRFGDAVAFDAVTGLRSISAERCREYLASHRAAAQAAAAQAAEMATRPVPMDQVRAHIAAIAERDERMVAAGQLDAGMTAFQRMAAADHQVVMERKSSHLDEMLRSGRDGTLTMHVYDQEEA